MSYIIDGEFPCISRFLSSSRALTPVVTKNMLHNLLNSNPNNLCLFVIWACDLGMEIYGIDGEYVENGW